MLLTCRLAAVVFAGPTCLGLAQAPPVSDTTRTASEYVAALRPALRPEGLLPFEGEERTTWGYLPGRRRGVALKSMNAAERAAAHAMLRAALSARGYEKTTGVLELEQILRDTETFGALTRDRDLYYLAIFGTPSDTAVWGWRFEGHHLSLNFSSATGKIVAATPMFLGSNPARVPDGPRVGWRVLAAEEDLARQLLGSLDEAQRRQAIIATDAPADIILGPGRKTVPDPVGLRHADMSAAQREILMRLVGEYVGNVREDYARGEREKIEKAGLGDIRFAWAGGTRVGQGHYYRIQGPTFVIEYDNTQNHANHVHSVFRDLQDDFGGDLLRRHYAESPHHAGARPKPST